MRNKGIEYLTSECKRNLDVIGAVALGSFAIPVATGLSMLSAIDTNDHPIFIQSRVGSKGQNFDVKKIRTLNRDSVNQDPMMRGSVDQRASRFGNFLRKTGLDELPQLANVFSGDMSLVGPRPIIEEDLNYIQEADALMFNDWYEVYTLTRPGLTGPSQLYRKGVAHSLDSWKSSMKLDLVYADKATLGGDIKLLGQTPLKLIACRR